MKIKKQKFKFVTDINIPIHPKNLNIYPIVNNPLPQYNNLPNGMYLIRGNKKYHFKIYKLFNNTWNLMEDYQKNYECIYNRINYGNIDIISKEILEKLSKIPHKYLNKESKALIYLYVVYIKRYNEVRIKFEKEKLKLKIGRYKNYCVEKIDKLKTI